MKRRILDYLAVLKLKGGETKGPILCFVGPPGIGKTSLGQSIARALGRKFIRVSLGGVRDEAEIRGHRRTYVGAMPGRIIQEIRRAGSNNPLMMLDEIDKLGADFRGDPASALLEVLDPAQNSTFTDHYLDVAVRPLARRSSSRRPTCTDTIPSPLLDRMEVIELPGYTEHEKLEIGKRYLLPRQIDENGIPESDSAGHRRRHPRDHPLLHARGRRPQPGTRARQRLPRRRPHASPRARPDQIAVTPDNLADFLGPPRFRWELAQREGRDRRGGRAGRDDGRRRRALRRGDGDPRQGPPDPHRQARRRHAGVGAGRADLRPLARRVARRRRPPSSTTTTCTSTSPPAPCPRTAPPPASRIATALVSVMTRRPICKDVAMTGEITLRGKVLPVGAVRDKVLAAHRAGSKRVIIPSDNENDLRDVPEDVRRDLEIILVEHVDEVLNAALHPEVREEKPKLAPLAAG